MLRPTLLLLLLGLLLIGATAAADSASGEEVKNKIPSFYDFTVPGPDGEEILLSERIDPTKKPVVLVVNVASKCGYTDTHYRQLQQMYEKYADSGLEIVAFPWYVPPFFNSQGVSGTHQEHNLKPFRFAPPPTQQPIWGAGAGTQREDPALRQGDVRRHLPHFGQGRSACVCPPPAHVRPRLSVC